MDITDATFRMQAPAKNFLSSYREWNHRKASLKAHTPAVHWIESFPLVLLGIRTALKNDLQCSTAELVYGTTLRLPGEFFQQSASDTPPDPTTWGRTFERIIVCIYNCRVVYVCQLVSQSVALYCASVSR